MQLSHLYTLRNPFNYENSSSSSYDANSSPTTTSSDDLSDDSVVMSYSDDDVISTFPRRALLSTREERNSFLPMPVRRSKSADSIESNEDSQGDLRVFRQSANFMLKLSEIVYNHALQLSLKRKMSDRRGIRTNEVFVIVVK